jgi:hypothetical protein
MTPLVAALLLGISGTAPALPKPRRSRTYDRPGGVFALIREAATPARAREIYLEACQEYAGASSGTKRKWERAAAARARQLGLLRQVVATVGSAETSA